MDQIVNGLETHFMTAVFVSGALALLIVAAVAFTWWRSRHWVDRGRASLATARHTTLLSQMDEPPPARPVSGGGRPEDAGRADDASSAGDAAPGGEQQLGSRLVREAAARAAGLRDAWDRSYREARGSATTRPTASSTPETDLPALMDELLREQRETKALLRQLVERLGQSDR